MSDDLKKCKNCSRGPQPLAEFEAASGRVCTTCRKCREKNKRRDETPKRREYHSNLQKEKGKEYNKKSREKKKAGIVDEHNLDQKCEWSMTDKTKERLSLWRRLNVNDRINSSKRTAISKGYEWNLTDEESGNMLTSPCFYCNHLDLETRLNGIDRLDSEKYYTTVNTVPCCWNCNFMKCRLDPRTFVEHCRKVALFDKEFPQVPIQSNIRPRKFKPTSQQPSMLPKVPKTPSQ